MKKIMKETMKKIYNTVLCMAILVSALTGCGSGAYSTEATTEPAAEAETTETAETTEAAETDTMISDEKIGVNYIIEGSYNVLACKNVSEEAIKAFGATPMTLCANGSLEQMNADFENMIESGCKGILIWFLFDEMLYNIMDKCEEAGVYFAFSDKAPSDPDVIAAAMENPYFAGTVAPNQKYYGTICAQAALDDGCRNAIIVSQGVGDATGTPRLEAFTEAFEAGGGTVITRIEEQEAPDCQASLENFLSGYDGELDVIFATCSDRADSAHLGAENAGFTGVKVVTGDLNLDVLGEMSDGWLINVVGDSWASPFFGTVLLQNAINGTPILDADGNKVWIDSLGVFGLENEKQIELYQKYFLDSFYFTPEECANMLIVNNPDFGYDAFVDEAASFSFESRMAQRLAEGKVTEEELTEANVNINQ